MKKNKLLGFIIGITSILSGIAIGGLFLDGTTLTNPILGLIPSIIHTLVGWLVIIGGILAGLGLFGFKLKI